MMFLRLFFFGVIASLSALFLELALATALGDAQKILYALFTQLTPLLIAAVLIEEISKFIFIYRSSSDLRSRPENMDDPDTIAKKIFLSSIYIGLGFSFIEILIVLFSVSLDQNLPQLALSVWGILTVHVITSSAMGYLLAGSRSVGFFLILKALVITASLHIFYNLLVIYSVGPLYVSLYLLSLISFFLVLFSKNNSEKIELNGS